MNHEQNHKKLQLEDKALKSAAIFFGEELLAYLGVSTKIRRLLPTEQIRLEAVRMTEDTNYEMVDGTIAHLEYQSSNISIEDFRRFREYEAFTSQLYGKPVITYVLCSGKAKIKSKFEDGINIYRIVPLHLKGQNADELISQLNTKIQNGERLTRKELLPLLLTPLMSGESSIRNRIERAQQMIKSDCTDIGNQDKNKMQAIIYAFICKFLDKDEQDVIKEGFSMTDFGEMIWNDGYERGISELIQVVRKKMDKGLPHDEIADSLEKDVSIIEQICNIIIANEDYDNIMVAKEYRKTFLTP